MKRRTWLFVLVGYALLGWAFVTLDGAAQQAVYYASGFGAAAAILAGVRLYQPRDRAPWYAFAGGIALFALGDVAFDVYAQALHVEAPVPSLADALYVSSYLVLAWGLVLLVGRRVTEAGLPAFVDGLLVAVSVGVLGWVDVVVPNRDGLALPLAERVTLLAYPALDLLLIAVLVRLVFAPVRRGAACVLVAASLVALLGTDGWYLHGVLNGTYVNGSAGDVGWVMSYALWAAAGLHPSMGEASTVRARRVASRLPVARLVLLAICGVATAGHRDHPGWCRR